MPSITGDGSSRPAVAPPRVGIRVILADPAVRVAILIIFVVMAGFGIILPIMPLYARSFGVSYQAASLLISGFAFARLVFDPIAGPIVDRYGERIASVAGVVLVGVSSILTAMAPNFTLAVLFRAAGGGGSSVLFAALYSYLLKVVPSDRMARTLSLFYGALNVGIIAGAPFGGLIAGAFDLNTPLFVYAAMCFLAAGLYLRYMRDPGPRIAAEPASPRPAESASLRPSGSILARGWHQVVEVLHRPAFVTVMALNFTFFWVVAGGYDTLVPLFGREGLGMSEAGVGAVFGIAVFAEFLVLYPAGSLADRIGRKPILLVALSALAVMLALVGFARTPFVLGAMMAGLGLCSGSAAAGPGAMLSDVVPGGSSATAVGVFRFAGDLGFVLGPLVAGATAGAFGFEDAFAILVAPVLLTLILIARTPETLHRDLGSGIARAVRPMERAPLDEG